MNRWTSLMLFMGVLAAVDARQASAESVHWKVSSTPDGWRLLRDGEPFDIAWPANRAPVIVKLQIEGFTDPQATYLQAARAYRAEVESTDPDSDPLAYAWDIRPEVVIPPGSYAGGLEKRVQPIPGLSANPATAAVEFTAPDQSGAYRLFVTVTDGQGHIAYGNLPFYVEE
jgi:hypothetical protein